MIGRDRITNRRFAMMRRILIMAALIAVTALSQPAMAAVMDQKIQPVAPSEIPGNLETVPLTALETYERSMRKGLRENPGHPAVMHALGTALFHQDKTDEAREMWTKAAAIDPALAPADVMADVHRVFRLQRDGDTEGARAQLEKAAQSHTDSPHFFLLRAEQAMKSRANRQAEEDYKRAHELAPNLFTTSLNLARFYEFTNIQNLARQYYEEAARKAPKRASTWDFLGSHQFRGGEYDAALTSFRQAEAVDDNQPLAELRLAQLFGSVGDHVGARHWYLQALERAEGGRDAIRVALSDVQLRLGLIDEARETLDAVLANEEIAPVLIARAAVDEALGDDMAAAKRYRRAILLDPGNIIAANNLAMALIRTGTNADEALVHADYARQKLPKNGAVFGTYALALAHAGERDRALKELPRAIRIMPEDPWLRYFYGMLLARAGDGEAARLHLEAVAILDPEFPRLVDVRQLLKDL